MRTERTIEQTIKEYDTQIREIVIERERRQTILSATYCRPTRRTLAYIAREDNLVEAQSACSSRQLCTTTLTALSPPPLSFSLLLTLLLQMPPNIISVLSLSLSLYGLSVSLPRTFLSPFIRILPTSPAGRVFC